MNVMISPNVRAGVIAFVVAMVFFYTMIAIADAYDWSRHAHAAIAAGALVIMVGGRLLLIGSVERRRLRSACRRHVRRAARRLRRRARLHV